MVVRMRQRKRRCVFLLIDERYGCVRFMLSGVNTGGGIQPSTTLLCLLQQAITASSAGHFPNLPVKRSCAG